jgi:hypothetical protein
MQEAEIPHTIRSDMKRFLSFISLYVLFSAGWPGWFGLILFLLINIGGAASQGPRAPPYIY